MNEIFKELLHPKLRQFIKENHIYSGITLVIIGMFFLFFFIGKIDWEIKFIDFVNLFIGLTIASIISKKIDNKKGTKKILIEYINNSITASNELFDFLKTTSEDAKINEIQLNSKKYYITKLDNKVCILTQREDQYILDEDVEKIKKSYYLLRSTVSDNPEGFKDDNYRNNCFRDLLSFESRLEKIKYKLISH